MTREWKPGDVGVTAETPVRFLVCKNDLFRYEDGDTVPMPPRKDARPLVVIDPEDREQVERLGEALFGKPFPSVSDPREVERLQADLREFANPTPPKPPEPTGLGAVVEDAEGADWHRTRDGRWIAEDGLRSRAAGWGHIAAVRVLSEGVVTR